jgi:hypothetical protein
MLVSLRWLDTLPPGHCLICRQPLRCYILFLQVRLVGFGC